MFIQVSQQDRFFRYVTAFPCCYVLIYLRTLGSLNFCVLIQRCYRLTSLQEDKGKSKGATTLTEGEMRLIEWLYNRYFILTTISHVLSVLSVTFFQNRK